MVKRWPDQVPTFHITRHGGGNLLQMQSHKWTKNIIISMGMLLLCFFARAFLVLYGAEKLSQCLSCDMRYKEKSKKNVIR